MLFNSPEFIFAFLPAILALFAIGQRERGNFALIALAAGSFFFYAWWDIWSLPILLISIFGNWTFGEAIRARNAKNHNKQARQHCTAGIAINLIALAYYKYSGFLVHEVASPLLSSPPDFHAPTLPIGISFFTFTQIAFLVDTLQNKSKQYSPVHYALFVNYFPHLIAGPILHHAEMIPQFEKVKTYSNLRSDIALGGGILLVGLAKKLLVADPVGGYVNIFYSGLATGTSEPGLFESLLATLGYSVQLYFDFSGYSDMAIGVSRMFGIDLPINFNSPYRATSIIEFWRRWHISLSTFLRDYLYIPLGGSRKGPIRRQVNLVLTMLLGGMWHGAGWTFIIWGGIHGTLLATNHGIRHLLHRLFAINSDSTPAYWRAISTALTFTAVTIAWIPFRAPDLPSALKVITGLTGRNGAALPGQILDLMPFAERFITRAGNVPLLADGTVMGFIEMTAMTCLGFIIALFFRNTQEMQHRTRLLIGAAMLPLILQRVCFGGKVEFLYFQF